MWNTCLPKCLLSVCNDKKKKAKKNFGLFLTYSQGQKQPFFVMLTGNYTRNQGLVCLLSWKTSLTSSEAIGPLEGRVKAAAVASIAAWGRVSYQFISCEAAVAKTTWLQLASNPSIPRWYRLNYSDRNLTGNPQDMIKHSVWKSLEKVSFQIVKIKIFWHF